MALGLSITDWVDQVKTSAKILLEWCYISGVLHVSQILLVQELFL